MHCWGFDTFMDYKAMKYKEGHVTLNQLVAGSIPAVPTISFKGLSGVLASSLTLIFLSLTLFPLPSHASISGAIAGFVVEAMQDHENGGGDDDD